MPIWLAGFPECRPLARSSLLSRWLGWSGRQNQQSRPMGLGQVYCRSRWRREYRYCSGGKQSIVCLGIHWRSRLFDGQCWGKRNQSSLCRGVGYERKPSRPCFVSEPFDRRPSLSGDTDRWNLWSIILELPTNRLVPRSFVAFTKAVLHSTLLHQLVRSHTPHNRREPTDWYCIGEFNATDPDAGATLTTILPGQGMEIIPSSRSKPTAPSRPPPLSTLKPTPRLISFECKPRTNSTLQSRNFGGGDRCLRR